MRFLFLTIISAMAFTANANAQDISYYGNVGVSKNRLDYTTISAALVKSSIKVENTLLNAKFGAQFNKYLALETEGSFGISDDKFSNITFKTKNTLGAYAVGFLPIGDKASLIGRVGYNYSWAEEKGATTKLNHNNGGLALGVGAQYMFDDKNGIRGDYTHFNKKDNASTYATDGVDNLAVSYVRKF